MGRYTEAVHIGVGGHVVALSIKTGEELWRTKLKTQQFVSVTVRGDRVFGASGGELFCLDAATGELQWHNKLKGLGLGFVSLAPGDTPAAAATQAAKAAAAAAG